MKYEKKIVEVKRKSGKQKKYSYNERIHYNKRKSNKKGINKRKRKSRPK